MTQILTFQAPESNHLSLVSSFGMSCGGEAVAGNCLGLCHSRLKQEILLDDSLTLESMQLQDDAVLYVVFPVADGEWEAVDVVADDSAMLDA